MRQSAKTPRSRFRPRSLFRLSGVLLVSLGLAGCLTTRNSGPQATPLNGVPEGEVPAEWKGPSGRSILDLERGLVLWFDAHTPADQGHPGRVAFFVARDLRGGLFLESLGFFESGTSLRLVPHEGALWLFPMGEGRVNAASLIYHPIKSPGREVTLTVNRRRVRARLLTHSDQGVELRLWFVEGEGLWRLELRLGGRETLRLERASKSRWGSRPAPYPAGDPVAAWESVEKALLTLDVIGLRQLMTKKLWSRLLPPGEGLTFSEAAVDGKRRLELIRQVVPQLLEVELTRTGGFEVQAGQAQASALLRTRIEGEFNQVPARLDLVSVTKESELRWLWAGFRPRPGPGDEVPDEDPLGGEDPQDSSESPGKAPENPGKTPGNNKKGETGEGAPPGKPSSPQKPAETPAKKNTGKEAGSVPSRKPRSG